MSTVQPPYGVEYPSEHRAWSNSPTNWHVSFDVALTRVKIKHLNRSVPVPAPATEGSAGYDLYANLEHDVRIWPGETVMIPLGIALDIRNASFAAMLLPRSGLGKQGLVLGNGTGIIDSDYQGELVMAAWNRNVDGQPPIRVSPGSRVCQMIFVPVSRPTLLVVDEFEAETARSTGGYGHTGT